MKKIGIVTLGNSLNYGGVLQATALSHFLKMEGVDSLFITVQEMPRAWNSMIKYTILRIKLFGAKGFYTKIRIVGGCVKTFLSNRHLFVRIKKIRKFKRFINRLGKF